MTKDKVKNYMVNVEEAKDEILKILDKVEINKPNYSFNIHNVLETTWFMVNNSRKAETECYKTDDDEIKQIDCQESVLSTTNMYKDEIANKLKDICNFK